MGLKKGSYAYSEKIERLVITFNSRNARQRSFCPKCGKVVDWLTIIELSAITGKNPSELSKMIADGEIEYMINDDCQFLICADSVFRIQQMS